MNINYYKNMYGCPANPSCKNCIASRDENSMLQLDLITSINRFCGNNPCGCIIYDESDDWEKLSNEESMQYVMEQ
jgi:hypothetical protein